MAGFQAAQPTGVAVAQLEVLVRTAVFKTANELVGWMLQQAVDRIDAAYQPKLGEERKGRELIHAQGIFGHFPLQRDSYYHPGKKQGHYPADAALGLEVGYTPALAKLLCLEGADEAAYLKAERHLEQTGGICVSARQIQRVVQRVGQAAQQWQERPAQPRECERCDASVIYLSADGTGVPMVPEELVGRKGKQADGKAKSRQVYLGCVFTQHKVDEKGRPVRDWDSTTYVSSFNAINDFGPLLRQEGLRRGMATAENIVLLIDETRKECAGKACAAAVEKALHYFVTNVSRMQYGTFRKAGYFIGSGVVEAGCKRVIGGRCKQSGMFWSERGAENVLALRCIHSSRRLEQFWKHRLNTKAAANDSLPLAA